VIKGTQKKPSITSHDLASLPATSIENLTEILNDESLLDNDEFYIDEGQFLSRFI